MKIQLFTVIVPNGIPEVRIYRTPEEADTWIKENGSHYGEPRYAPATIDVSLDWLTEMMSRAAAELGVQPIPQQTVIMGSATFGPTTITIPGRK
jgi:hypothetical protein